MALSTANKILFYKSKGVIMKITRDSIGVVIEYQDIIRRYCNFTEQEAIRDFKDFMCLRGVNIKG